MSSCLEKDYLHVCFKYFTPLPYPLDLNGAVPGWTSEFMK